MIKDPARSKLTPTFRYWMEVEVHVYGFSVAASVLLSFFPFLIVMVSLCKYVLQWQGAEQAIYLALGQMFPDEMGQFLVRNLKATVMRRGPFQYVSVLLLFFAANGVFEPLEVALNRVWGAGSNRSYFRNQLLSMALILTCGALALVSFALTAMNRELLEGLGAESGSFLAAAVFKFAAAAVTIVILFLVYWLLPHTHISPLRVAPIAILVGLSLEALKYSALLLWPWLRIKLQNEYGPFQYSAMILLWSFFAAMLVLGGAEWAARRGMEMRAAPEPEEPEEPVVLR